MLECWIDWERVCCVYKWRDYIIQPKANLEFYFLGSPFVSPSDHWKLPLYRLYRYRYVVQTYYIQSNLHRTKKKMKDTNSIFNTTYYNVFADRVSKRALILRLHVAPAAAASVVMVAAVGSLYSSHAYYIGQCAIFHSPNIPISYPVPCVECCCCCCCSLTRMWCAMVWKQQREITRVRPFANALSYECGNHVYPLWWSDTNRLALSPSLSLPHRRRRLADSAQICWRPMNEKKKR